MGSILHDDNKCNCVIDLNNSKDFKFRSLCPAAYVLCLILSDLEVRVPGYRSRGPGFDLCCYRVFLKTYMSQTGSTQTRDDKLGTAWNRDRLEFWLSGDYMVNIPGWNRVRYWHKFEIADRGEYVQLRMSYSGMRHCVALVTTHVSRNLSPPSSG
jgi:hypothetical protein